MKCTCFHPMIFNDRCARCGCTTLDPPKQQKEAVGHDGYRRVVRALRTGSHKKLLINKVRRDNGSAH